MFKISIGYSVEALCFTSS